MDYNSNRKKLLLPEYGRNIQKMVDFAVAIEDREERNRAAKTIIDIMGNMHPYLRDIPDFRHKLWDHLAIMSEFKLNIDAPYDPPKPEVLNARPKPLPYNSSPIKYRHYGRTMELLIKKAAEHEEGEQKKVLIQLLANHMKKSFLAWNKDAVEDDKIFKDIDELSDGGIRMADDYKLTETKDLLYNRRYSKRKGGKGSSSNYSHHHKDK